MCKVYEFPMKKELPNGMKERLDKVVREFVCIIDENIDILYGDNPTEKEYEEFMECIMTVYMELLENAVDELI